MHQPEAGLDLAISGRVVNAAEHSRIKGRKSRGHGGPGRGDKLQQLIPSNAAACSEFSVAIAHVAGISQLGADEVPQVADQVQRQIAAGVRTSWHRLPQTAVVRILPDLPGKRVKFTRNECLKMRNHSLTVTSNRHWTLRLGRRLRRVTRGAVSEARETSANLPEVPPKT